MIKNYPLQWPVGYPRTTIPGYSRFQQGLEIARYQLVNEVGRLGGTELCITTNIKRGNSGIFLSDSKQPADTGVAVYFNYKGKPMVLACDKWCKVQDNITAVYKTIEAIRGIEHWGVSDFLERSFTGFEALPQKEYWWQVLEVEETASTDRVKEAYRRLMIKYHPDRGGNSVDFQRVTIAYNEFLNLKK